MGLKQKARPGDSRAAMLLQPVQWVAAWEITQILEPFRQVTGTPGRESTVQLKKKKMALRQGARCSGLAGPTPTKTNKTAIGNTLG